MPSILNDVWRSQPVFLSLSIDSESLREQHKQAIQTFEQMRVSVRLREVVDEFLSNPIHEYELGIQWASLRTGKHGRFDELNKLNDLDSYFEVGAASYTLGPQTVCETSWTLVPPINDNTIAQAP